MNIQQEDDGKIGMFFIEQDDKRVAKLVIFGKTKTE